MAGERIIARMHDGLGNQLFIYAAARAIAAARGAELLLDTRSAFAHDKKYGAISQLQHFAIKAEIAPKELCFLPPFGRQRRDLLISLSKHLPLSQRFVLREADYDALRVGAPVRRLVRLEGYWQSERYFSSIADEIADELSVTSPLSPRSQDMMALIEAGNAVALHIRQRRGAHHDTNKPPPTSTPQLPFSYYEEAVARVGQRTQEPVFFCFGDNTDWIKQRWTFPYPVHFVDHNTTQDRAYEDLALMQACKHFVVGNSTFSWWGAWLARNPEKYVVAPANEGNFVWGSEKDLIPKNWDVLKIAGA